MPVSPKSLKNLVSPKKGEIRNPKGRPTKLPNLDILLAEILGEEKNGKTAAEAILAALRAKATKGDIRAAELILDRAYGKAKQSLEHTGKDGEPIFKPLSDSQVDKIISALRETKTT